MGINYLWDTNTCIYYLQQQFPTLAEKRIDTILLTDLPVISAITEIELLCWQTTSENDLQTLKDFISDVMVIELEQAIKLKTAELRKTNKIKLPDAIIASTAIIYNLTLITRNTIDFKNIDGLQLMNPFEL